jgi:hypothetical protein
LPDLRLDERRVTCVEELSRIISDATRLIEPAYFRLNIAGGDPVYRERVYCYELYHQMRVHWSADTPYYLNGEVDKTGHSLLTELGVGRRKPDLLVHRPGDMIGNHAVIEVKRRMAPGPRAGGATAVAGEPQVGEVVT